MAWTALTVVTQAGHKKRWSVLAAAGLRGHVRLLHVRAGFCCGVIRAHKRAIATLCFSPTHETHLFSKTLSRHPQGSPSTPVLPPQCSLPGMVRSSYGWQPLLAANVDSGCGRSSVASWTTDWASDPGFSPHLLCGLGAFLQPGALCL